jgi:hypothetical protein
VVVGSHNYADSRHDLLLPQLAASDFNGAPG